MLDLKLSLLELNIEKYKYDSTQWWFGIFIIDNWGTERSLFYVESINSEIQLLDILFFRIIRR